jgi:predicted ester cyclase
MEGLYAGTNTGEFGPFAATGRVVSLPWTNVYKFDGNGRIVNVNVYYDQLTIMTQLGHMEGP